MLDGWRSSSSLVARTGRAWREIWSFLAGCITSEANAPASLLPWKASRLLMHKTYRAEEGPPTRWLCSALQVSLGHLSSPIWEGRLSTIGGLTASKGRTG